MQTWWQLRSRLLWTSRPRLDPNRQRERALALLRHSLNDPEADFRDGQWEAIEALVARRERLLVVQRTGWGKSAVYFLATHLLRESGAGPTLIVSPLLALMRDQLRSAHRLGIRAATINSANHDEWGLVYRDIREDRVDALLIAPERLANKHFREELLGSIGRRVGLLVVDEAHCISDWGHDFRPDYRRIPHMLRFLPRGVPILATTATANERVVTDITETFGSRLRCIRGPLTRPSLCLQTVPLPRPTARMAWLAETLPELPGSGIVYTLTIRDAWTVAAWLQLNGIDARPYWGALDTTKREELEWQLLRNRVKALVATVALGMGFDKPDLGFVVHYQRPASPVHYYQQVGRAGRALSTAHGIMLCGDEDRDIANYFIDNAFPTEQEIALVLDALQGARDGLTPVMLEAQVNLSPARIDKALRSLAVRDRPPVEQRGQRWYRTSSRYRPNRKRMERITGIRRREQERMQAYTTGADCLMRFLAHELDDFSTSTCGRCSVCRAQVPVSGGWDHSREDEAISFLRRSDVPIEPQRLFPAYALDRHGWRGAIPVGMQVERGRALSVWGDGAWGSMVRRGKTQMNSFDDALVSAAADMIERWRPVPAPRWITCVPSLVHPELVPDFARRLAHRLEVPFHPCVHKLRPTPPQKSRENSFQQAHNLEGAFGVVPPECVRQPLFLVDDMVDSGWTFAVVGALLREAGSGPVFPLALTMTSAASSRAVAEEYDLELSFLP